MIFSLVKSKMRNELLRLNHENVSHLLSMANLGLNILKNISIMKKRLIKGGFENVQINELQKKEKNLLEEFVEVTFQLSEEELQAVHGIIPMTQEIYDRCAQKCEEEGAVRQLEELIAQFPEQHCNYRERMRQQEESRKGKPENTKQDGVATRELSKEELQTNEAWKEINSQLEKIK